MELKKSISTFSIARIYCSIFGHRFKVSNLITNHIKEYKCCSCGEEVTDTANGVLAELTPKSKETNRFLAKFYQKRCRKIFSEAS